MIAEEKHLCLRHDSAADQRTIVRRCRRELRDRLPELLGAADKPDEMARAYEAVDRRLAEWEGEALGEMMRLREIIGRSPPRRYQDVTTT